MNRLKPLVNLQEAAVDRDLQRWADSQGYRLTLKTRLRDVVDDDPSWTRRERDFAFMAHLDFVAFDAETLQPVLAVEYDGKQHLTDTRQRERDALKDRLCAGAGLTLLRIDSQFARKEGRWRVLGYILQMHEYGKAFAAAQQDGLIPADEPFVHNSIIDTSDPEHPSFTGLDTAAIERLHTFAASGRMHWSGHWWRDTDGTTEAKCVLSLRNGQYLTSSCTLRSFAIEGISSLAVAEELAMAELGWLIHRYEADEPVALNKTQGEQLLAGLEADNEWHCSGGMNLPG
ncbi:DUF2726 domain-containing protein [Flexivirga endophytica]|uniref:DUF2726 domain-containing protein n=1 Tax=Flexivirga endophytica TaxID=1849103 RepID=UPI00166C1730|nr:DUF2726 domain-containing protein [Flexivirga endophytica]